MNPIQPPPPMSYQHLQAENEYVKHNMAYQQNVIQYNYQSAHHNYHDAQRWRKFKELLEIKQGQEKVSDLEKQVDLALRNAK